MPELYRIIQFKRNCGSCGGSLIQFQQGDSEENALPFEIGKVLVMSDIRTDDVRGLHAHYETEEILVALSGGCVVDLDDGRGTHESVRLSACGSSGVEECGSSGVEECGSSGVEECGSAGVHGCGSKGVEAGNTDTPKHPYSDTKAALLLYPHIWRVMRDFEPGTTLMVVANIKYDEADYIRDRGEFERVAKDWMDLGGSAVRESV